MIKMMKNNVVNIDLALELIGGHEQILEKVINSFLTKRIFDTFDYSTCNNINDLKLLVHSCKGISKNIGSEALYEIASKLERALDNNADDKKVNRLYRKFEETYNLVEEELRSYSVSNT